MNAAKRPSTRQLLVKIPNFPCLCKHKDNGIYYGIKKVRGKEKDHSLDTSTRPMERNSRRPSVSTSRGFMAGQKQQPDLDGTGRPTR